MDPNLFHRRISILGKVSGKLESVQIVSTMDNKQAGFGKICVHWNLVVQI